MGSETVKLYVSANSIGYDGCRVIGYKVIEKKAYFRKPIKALVDTRPAMLKYKQEIEFQDPKQVGKKSPRKVVIEGYFKRTGPAEYRQMTPDEIKKMLGWMLRTNTKPQDLTLEQMDKVLSMVLEVNDGSSIVVPGAEGGKQTPGGLYLPGS